jgi:isocitrate/isopropylmalate dehydrogenase
MASMAMLLEHSFSLTQEAAAITQAIDDTLAGGLRTVDIAEPGTTPASTSQFTAAVTAALSRA